LAIYAVNRQVAVLLGVSRRDGSAQFLLPRGGPRVDDLIGAAERAGSLVDTPKNVLTGVAGGVPPAAGRQSGGTV
jgi:hypothetical protein